MTIRTEPHLVHVVRTESLNVVHYPAFDRTITDVTEVQELYTAALALPPMAPGSRDSCPNDNGLVYRFEFQNVTVGSQMKLDATGCQFITTSSGSTSVVIRKTNSAFLNLVAQDLGFVNLSDQNPIIP